MAGIGGIHGIYSVKSFDRLAYDSETSQCIERIYALKLEEIRGLCVAATPGPWTLLGDEAPTCWIRELCYGYEGDLPTDDARFIAMARTVLPKLLAVAEAAKGLKPKVGHSCFIASSSCEACRMEDALADALAALENE